MYWLINQWSIIVNTQWKKLLFQGMILTKTIWLKFRIELKIDITGIDNLRKQLINNTSFIVNSQREKQMKRILRKQLMNSQRKNESKFRIRWFSMILFTFIYESIFKEINNSQQMKETIFPTIDTRSKESESG